MIDSEVLEHVAADQYEASLSEIARVAGKTIIVTVPNRENLTQETTRCPSCGHKFNASYHVRTHEPRALSDPFPRFSLERSEEFGHPYRTAGRFESLVRWGLLRRWLTFRSGFTCPSCGYHQTGAKVGGKNVPAQKKKSRIKNILSRLLGRRRPRWILAVYARDFD